MDIFLNMLAAWVTLLAYVGFAFRPFRAQMSNLSKALGDWSVLLLLLPFVLASGLAPGLDGLLNMVFYLALPTLWLSLGCRLTRWRGVFNALAVLSIWLPIEPDLFLLFISPIVPAARVAMVTWSARLSLPQTQALLAGDISLPMGMMTAILLTLYLFLIHRPLTDIGFNFRWRWGDLKYALAGLAGFGLVGIPLGMQMGFLRMGENIPGAGESLGMALAGYLLVALPEEVLFRGVIQNMLEKGWGRFWAAWPAASFLFGMAHLNNSTPRFPVPNWGYVAMATLAGLVYGWVYARSKKVTVSAITHASVNLIWGILFTT